MPASTSPRKQFRGHWMRRHDYHVVSGNDQEEMKERGHQHRGRDDADEKQDSDDDEDVVAYYHHDHHLEDLVPMLPSSSYPSTSSSSSLSSPSLGSPSTFVTAAATVAAMNVRRKARRKYLLCLSFVAILGTVGLVYLMRSSVSASSLLASTIDPLIPDIVLSAEGKAQREKERVQEAESKVIERLRSHHYHSMSASENEKSRLERLALQQKVYEVEPLLSQRPVLACLDEWIGEGKLCDGLRHAWSGDAGSRSSDINLARRHDIVVTWVNGSDARHTRARKMYASVDGQGSYDEWALSPSTYQKNTVGVTVIDGQAGHARARPIIRPTTGETEKQRQQRLQLGDAENRYRDNGELQFALRSIRDNLQSLGNFHLVTPDFAAPIEQQSWIADKGVAKEEYDVGLPSSEPVEGSLVHPFLATGTEPKDQLRWGQAPSWLDAKKMQGSSKEGQKPALLLHHDSQAFRPLWATAKGQQPPAELVQSWRKQALPTFNSMAIESMLLPSSVDGLSETYLSGNDDFFLTSTVAATDITNPFSGPILRFQPDLLVDPAKPSPPLNPSRRPPKKTSRPSVSNGEWPSLTGGSTLLSNRFGRRGRPYVVHQYRTYVGPLRAEMQHMFREDMDVAGRARFRGAMGADRVNIQLMAYHFIIERHREALLWSALVAKLDTDGDDFLSEGEWKALLELIGWKELSLSPSSASSDSVSVRFPNRRSLASDDGLSAVLDQAGLDKIRATKLQFTSADGYPWTVLDRAVQDKSTPRRGGVQRPSKEMFPDFIRDANNKPEKLHRFDDNTVSACQISISKCLGKNAGPGSRVQAIFKRFAFEEPSCGDCLITHLVARSGQRGLSAFLPDKDLQFPTSKAVKGSSGPPMQPHLPTDAQYQKADFSLANVGASTRATGHYTRRRFAEALFLRYAYVIGDSRGRFIQLKSQRQAKTMLGNIVWERERTKKLAATLGEQEPGGKAAPVAFLCLNDDLNPLKNDTLREEIQSWGQKMFPNPLPFERAQG